MAQWMCQIFYFKFAIVAIEFNLLKPQANNNKTYVELDNKNGLKWFAILLAYVVVNIRLNQYSTMVALFYFDTMPK